MVFLPINALKLWWQMVFLTNSDCYNMNLLTKINRPLGIFHLGCIILQHTVQWLWKSLWPLTNGHKKLWELNFLAFFLVGTGKFPLLVLLVSFQYFNRNGSFCPFVGPTYHGWSPNVRSPWGQESSLGNAFLLFSKMAVFKVNIARK